MFRAGALVGMMALIVSVTVPASAEEVKNPAAVAIALYENNPAFQEFQRAGNARGDRGAAQPNRFTPYLGLFYGFAPASQDFILRAFEAGKLTSAPEGEGQAFRNGKLAVNLIRMTQDIETQTRYIEVRDLPENGNLPRASDELARLLRDFPDVRVVLSPAVQRSIIALEEDVLAVLGEENAAQRTQITRLRQENADLVSTGAGLDRLNRRLESILAAIDG